MCYYFETNFRFEKKKYFYFINKFQIHRYVLHVLDKKYSCDLIGTCFKYYSGFI